ncbi:MAG: TolC family protein [bacterium]|nr:TolC family protein [bacterium]
MRKVIRTILLLVLTCGVGCNRFYANWADKTAYSTIRGGQGAALGENRDFDVKYSPFKKEKKLNAIRVGKKVITIGKVPQKLLDTESNSAKLNLDDGLIKLTLNECLTIAYRSSRGLQDRKEQLFSDALTVANGRRSWDFPLFDLNLDSDVDHAKVHAGSETAAGTGEAELSITQRFINGGVLTMALALDTATDFVSWHSYSLGSMLDANFTQPLLRGARTGLAYEDQYRLERDFVLAVFNYERFTQTFGTGILTQYYGVLRDRDTLENEWANIARLKQTYALTRVQVEVGQASRIAQDEAEQNLLNAQTRLQRSAETYRNSLDAFKIALGLPVATDMTVDYPRALNVLMSEAKKSGLKALGFDESRAIKVAMLVRPDLLTQRADTRDAVRDVEIAADSFLPQLDLALGLDVADAGGNRSTRLRWDEHTRTVGVTFQYSIDQTDNRDTYRNAMLTAEQANRDLEEFEDNVKLSVRRSYRSLVQSAASYALQLRSVKTALARRKLAALEQKEGLASTDDVLRAEESLRTAQNGLTQAMVTYTTTRLNFLASLGMIEVDDKGRLNERKQPFRFERIRKRYTYLGGR